MYRLKRMEEQYWSERLPCRQKPLKKSLVEALGFTMAKLLMLVFALLLRILLLH